MFLSVPPPRETFGMFFPMPEAGKPRVLWVAGMEPGDHETLAWLEDPRIPVFPSPEKAIRVLTALHRLQERSRRLRPETGPPSRQDDRPS